MKQNGTRSIRVAMVCLTGILSWSGTASATLITDNFDDNSLNATFWQTSNPPGASVTEAGQELRLTDGGSLVTQDDFDPDTGPPLTVTGQMTVNTVSDRLFFYTHGGGLLADAGGERHNGMKWFITGFNSTVSLDSIVLRDSTGGSLGSPTSSSDLTGIVAGSTLLDFTWVTTDTSSTFDIEVASGDASGASGSFSASVGITGPLTFGHSTRYVIFQNNNNGVTLDLDNLSINNDAPPMVPEPSTSLLLGLGALGLVRRTRRRRRRA